jgi:hypothetical protein
MTIQITAVRYGGTYKTHSSISELRYRDLQTQQVRDVAKPALVAWLDQSKTNQAIVSDGIRSVNVGTVHPQYDSPYVRTYADGTWTDNLLALPIF